MPVVGFLSARSPAEAASVLRVFRQALGKAGYFEGKNVTIEYRWADGQYDRLPALASDLVDRPVAVLTCVALIKKYGDAALMGRRSSLRDDPQRNNVAGM